MSKNSAIFLSCLLAVLGSAISVRAEDTLAKSLNAEQSKPGGWEDPQPKLPPVISTDDQSRERRSALEERVRYLEEQAAALARELDAERLRRAALEASTAAAKREADALKAKVSADQQKARELALAVEALRPRGRTRQAVKAIDGTRNIARSTFILPNALRPIKF